MSETWGEKIMISIYVEGQHDDAPSVAILAADQASAYVQAHYGDELDFVGAAVRPVDERPQGQDAS